MGSAISECITGDKVNTKAIATIVGGGISFALAQAIPVIMDKKPDEVAETLRAWVPVFGYLLPFLYAVAALLIVIGIALVAYDRGRRAGDQLGYNRGLTDGEAHAITSGPQPNLVQRHIDDAAPARKHAVQQTATADQLIYCVREIVDALTAPGILNDETVGMGIARLKREQPVWHIATNYNLRKSFVDIAERARAARIQDGNAAYLFKVDYKPEERDHHVNSLKNCGNKLIEYLGTRESRLRDAN